MKKIATLLALAALVSACASDTDPIGPNGTRTLTVNSALTRTTIDYEGSDFSHLVWSEGDRVAYVTDAAGQTFRTATVERNRFEAQIPAGATDDNSLLVVWPAGGLDGQPLSAAAATLPAEITQAADAPFDGSLLPMYADVAIPAGGSQVDAAYRVLGSVVRFAIDATGHETETLRSVTLRANEQLAGNYTFSAGEWTFEGTSQTVKATVTGDKALLDHESLVYMAVHPASYTGVEVTVETDVDTYVFPDGAMNLAQEGRTLYRIDLALSERPEPVIPYFTQVTDTADLTPDGTYLIVSRRDPSTYYTPGRWSSMSMLPGEMIGYSSEGVAKSDEVMKYVWKIVRNDAGNYSLWSELSGRFIGSPGAIVPDRDYGKFFSKTEMPQDDTALTTYHWGITLDAQRALIRSLRVENLYFKYNADPYMQYFCTCTPATAAAQDILILKLRE